VAGRTSTFIGPLVFGTLSYRMYNYYINQGLAELAAEKAGQYWGIGSIIAFLVIGMVILLSVREVTAVKPMIYHKDHK